MGAQNEASIANLVEHAVDDLRELAAAEVALIKAESKQIGMLIGVAVITLTAAVVLLALALGIFVAWIVLRAGGDALAALLATSATLTLVAAGGGVACIQSLRARVRGVRGEASRERPIDVEVA